MRKRIAVIGIGLLAGLVLTMSGALADPDFGTGESSKKNNDPGAVCSPSPNLDAELPQCK